MTHKLLKLLITISLNLECGIKLRRVGTAYFWFLCLRFEKHFLFLIFLLEGSKECLELTLTVFELLLINCVQFLNSVNKVNQKLPLKFDDKGILKSSGDIDILLDNLRVVMNEYPPPAGRFEINFVDTLLLCLSFFFFNLFSFFLTQFYFTVHKNNDFWTKNNQ